MSSRSVSSAALNEQAKFKQKLYQNFKEAGLLDNLKVTLRRNLLDKLQAVAPESNPRARLEQQQLQRELPFVLRRKFQDVIIADYLQVNGYEYTASIFMPQASLCNLTTENLNMYQIMYCPTIENQDCLTQNEMCRILDIEDHKYTGLRQLKPGFTSNDSMSFLDILIYIYYSIMQIETFETHTQTDYEEPVSKKLELIDKQYLSKMDYWSLTSAGSGATGSSVNQQIQKARRDVEQRVRADFEHEKTLLKEQIEARVKRQESDRHYKLLLLSNREKDAQIEKKQLELKRRQKEVLDSLERKRKQCEEQVVKIRQKEQEMIKQLEWKNLELEKYYDEKTKYVREREKQLQKMEMQVRVKKREYEDAIRMVKNKIVQEASRM